MRLTRTISEEVAGVEWYFGHWHEDKTYRNFHCLYNKIVELK